MPRFELPDGQGGFRQILISEQEWTRRTKDAHKANPKMGLRQSRKRALDSALKARSLNRLLDF